MNLYERHVPRTPEDVFGQEEAVALLRDVRRRREEGADAPQCYIFTGPYGCGKSALAQLLAGALGCEPVVFNSASTNGVDFGRRFASEILPYGAMGGAGRAYIIEEAHKMTPEAQESLLVPLEKHIPPGNAVILTTTDPGKVRRFIASGRAVRVEVRPLTVSALRALLGKVDAAEGFGIGAAPDLIERIACAAAGSARLALTLLETVAALPPDARKAWRPPDHTEDGKESWEELRDALAAATALAAETAWDGIAETLRKIKADGDDPEGVRRFLCATYAGRLMSPKCAHSRKVDFFALSVFGDRPYYDAGHPGLVYNCREFVTGLRTPAG